MSVVLGGKETAADRCIWGVRMGGVWSEMIGLRFLLDGVSGAWDG